jgi:hypothetical protein
MVRITLILRGDLKDQRLRYRLDRRPIGDQIKIIITGGIHHSSDEVQAAGSAEPRP